MNKKEVIDLLNEFGNSDSYIKAIKDEIEILKDEVISLRELTAKAAWEMRIDEL